MLAVVLIALELGRGNSLPTVWMIRAGRWVCPLLFELGHVLQWAWQEVKGEAASVRP